MKKLLLLFLLFNSTIINSQNKNMETEYKYDQEKLNSAGQREGELIHTSYDGIVDYRHLYKEGKLIWATHYRYSVEGIRPLVGKYKGGNPFDGYFVYKNELEIPIIDYYEKGTFTFQYTCSLLDLISSEGQEFNLKFTKTTFKDNKPQDGLVHSDETKLGSSHLVASEYYKDGKITDVDIWIMAMHYAELIKLKFLPNGYKIYKEVMPNVEDPVIDNKYRSITVEFKNPENGSILFEVENQLILKYDFSYTDLSKITKTSPGLLFYFLTNDKIIVGQYTSQESNKELYEEAYGNNPNIISSIFERMYSQLLPYFSNAGNNDYSLIIGLDKRITTIPLYRDEKGSAITGFLIEKAKESGYYNYIQYEDSKIISQKEALKLETLKELKF
ncbi:hypothetical protein [Flavobacterium piscis]|uniref:WG repeat-containing protein n=1 Tax=Flavobacterium piscis TaxID=1114874 RepID=A0ABU1YCX2_9FLAO|nr:hypothetical protein [Flavobacterium piscis]MDR7212091.1 hypothetical protein [Flavobacterium piscis]